MSFQFITDSNGQPTGVFIPIEEWNKLKLKYKDLDQNETEIPQWQINQVNERLAEYKKNPDTAEDFDKAMDDIDDEL